MMSHGNSPAGGESWLRCEESGNISALRDDEVHVWRAGLDLEPEKLVGLESDLMPDELARANRFRFPEHRARFIAARGILRRILGIHLCYAPKELRFAYGEHGKPALEVPAEARVEFNLSHSGGIALYAVALAIRVGVDVEFIKERGSWLRIAEQYFTSQEATYLAGLPGEASRSEFFALWAQKEARLKAAGTGLHFPLDETVDLGQWSVINLNPMPGYAAALAFEARQARPKIIRHHFTL